MDLKIIITFKVDENCARRKAKNSGINKVHVKNPKSRKKDYYWYQFNYYKI